MPKALLPLSRAFPEVTFTGPFGFRLNYWDAL